VPGGKAEVPKKDVLCVFALVGNSRDGSIEGKHKKGTDREGTVLDLLPKEMGNRIP
jgi:hypothetical protein